MSRDSFPRQAARTRNFRLGTPRQVSVSGDGRRIVLVRSGGGTDPVNRLIVVDVSDDGLSEREVADPLVLLGGDEHLPAAERARRERMRESTAGITSYSADATMARAVFALSGQLFAVDLGEGAAPARELPARTPVIDPRISPDGRWAAYVHDRALRVISLDSGDDRALASPESDTVTWGLADFIAAEELDRIRGHWWAPDSSALLAERFDDALVATWWISDPASPGSEPTPHRYPAAGTANAAVGLHLLTLDGGSAELEWDQVAYPYLAGVSWTAEGPPLITALSRDQRRLVTIAADPGSGITRVLREDEDPAWIDLMPGLPRWSTSGELIRPVDDVATDTRRLAVGESLVTPPGAQLMGLAGVSDEGVQVVLATDPTERVPALVGVDGSLRELAPRGAISSAVGGGGTWVIASTTMGSTGTSWRVLRDGRDLGELVSHAHRPDIVPSVRVLRAGASGIVTAVLLPSDHVPGSRRLPVIMAPYGGPHHSEVLASGLAFSQDQWIADQGFAVVVADGRGTPGRGPAWEKAVLRNFVDPVLDDQVTALQAAAEAFPDDLDLTRVGIMGWSFGGWLAGLAVLERPDVFHAAVAGAPVTDWRLYDTAYTERYLGHPDAEPAVYEHNSLVARADRLRRPLMLVHGLADDNVVMAHTLALSGALLASGCPHTVLPLTGVTHMATQEDVAENLLLLQVDFLRRSL